MYSGMNTQENITVKSTISFCVVITVVIHPW